MIGRTAGGALLATGVAALALIPVASGSPSQVTSAKAPVKRTVKVRDYYFSPESLKVPRKSTIRFKWPSAGNEGDTHDVKLKKGPEGVKHWHSELAASDYTFRRKLWKKGKYKFICTLHPYDMHTTIRVR